MTNKIRNRFSELSKISSLIIKHGMQISCLLMCAGLAVYLINIYSGGFSLYKSSLAKYIIEAAVTIFAEIIIGGLAFDYTFKKHNTEE